MVSPTVSGRYRLPTMAAFLCMDVTTNTDRPVCSLAVEKVARRTTLALNHHHVQFSYGKTHPTPQQVAAVLKSPPIRASRNASERSLVLSQTHLLSNRVNMLAASFREYNISPISSLLTCLSYTRLYHTHPPAVSSAVYTATSPRHNIELCDDRSPQASH